MRDARPTDRLDEVAALCVDGIGLELPGDVPSAENLLVLHLESTAAVAAVAARLCAKGHEPVEAENPHWEGLGAVTIPDPGAWRLVWPRCPLDRRDSPP